MKPFNHIILLLALLLAGCGIDEPITEDSMPITLSIPMDGLLTRGPGDPGGRDVFRVPQYAYLFLANEYNGSTSVSASGEIRLADDWKKQTLSRGISTNDSIYTYQGKLTMFMPQRREKGRIYAVLSADQVPGLSGQVFASEEALLNFQFNLSAALQNGGLKDLYATPYNLYIDDDGKPVTSGGRYYGTVNNFTSQYSYLNLVLYHVAAKVDLLWNVDASLQDQISIASESGMVVQNLKAEGCYLFRPLDNVGLGNNAYTHSISIDAGNQWYGRSVFYAIPYRTTAGGSYPLNLRFTYHDNRQASKTSTKTLEQAIDLTAVNSDYTAFTPWLRGILNINQGTVDDN